MPDSKLAAVCTHPDGDGLWFSVDRIGEPCPDSDCGDCQPVYYVAASAIEQEVERLKTEAAECEIAAAEYEAGSRSHDTEAVAASVHRDCADRLQSILNEQGGGSDGTD